MGDIMLTASVVCAIGNDKYKNKTLGLSNTYYYNYYSNNSIKLEMIII
jgi:hypothetical protein